MRCNPVVFVPFFLLLACSGPLAPVAPRLMVRFLDVGQGDAALITWPGGQRLLVDAGPDSGGADTLLINSGVTSLDGMALTHAHGDHTGGARAILKRLSVRRVLLPGRTSTWTPGFTELVRYVADTLRIDTLMLTAGEDLSRAGYPGARCLFPDTLPRLCQQADSLNAYSLVIDIRYGSASLLMAGDINFDSEAALLAENALLETTLLKVPHHGSGTSASSAFLDRLRPRLSVVSAGAHNPFGHPAGETIDRLRKCGSRILRTDSAGSLGVELDSAGGIY